MSDPESKRQDRFESFVRGLLRKADENRNYVVGGVVALVLVAGAIYFRIAAGQRVEREAWNALNTADSTALLRERWEKYGDRDVGPFLAVELANRLFQEQRDLADKAEPDAVQERLTLLDEAVRVLSSAIGKHGTEGFGERIQSFLETVRAEQDWVKAHGEAIVAAREPVTREVAPLPGKLEGVERMPDAKGNAPRVLLRTDRGEILVELFEDAAPNHVANFLALTLEGFYDGMSWHRVEDWVVQTGDPEGTGGGGPGYRIRSEITEEHGHDRGAFGMARSQGMDTAGSQFYIVKEAKHDIDGQYTIFGKVLTGMDVVDRLQKGDRLLEMKVVRMRDHDYAPKVIRGESGPQG